MLPQPQHHPAWQHMQPHAPVDVSTLTSRKWHTILAPTHMCTTLAAEHRSSSSHHTRFQDRAWTSGIKVYFEMMLQPQDLRPKACLKATPADGQATAPGCEASPLQTSGGTLHRSHPHAESCTEAQMPPLPRPLLLRPSAWLCSLGLRSPSTGPSPHPH